MSVLVQGRGEDEPELLGGEVYFSRFLVFDVVTFVARLFVCFALSLRLLTFDFVTFVVTLFLFVELLGGEVRARDLPLVGLPTGDGGLRGD